jgi:hypothetical protein
MGSGSFINLAELACEFRKKQANINYTRSQKKNSKTQKYHNVTNTHRYFVGLLAKHVDSSSHISILHLGKELLPVGLNVKIISNKQKKSTQEKYINNWIRYIPVELVDICQCHF